MREMLIELFLGWGGLSDYAEDMADYLIENGLTIQRWIPVTERLPEEDGVMVLVCGSRKGIYTAEFRRNGQHTWFHKMNSKCHHCEPTHWMPLPEPPKGE